MKVSAPIFFLIFLISSAGHAVNCINANGNPSSRFFVDQFENAPEGSFIDMFKKSKPPAVLASTCDNCDSIEPSTNISVSPLPLGEISIDVTSPSEPQNTFQIKIEKSFWGNYFYRDENGKKVSLKRQEAFDLMTRLKMERMREDLNQKITGRTQDIMAERMQKRSAALTEKMSEDFKERQEQTLAESYIPSMPTVNPQCVERSLNKLSPGKGGSKRGCEGDRGNGIAIKSTPCITSEISEYIAWSINRAFECVNDAQDPLDANLFFKKLNLESNFNFWLENRNTGKGIGQLTFNGVQEVMGYHYDKERRGDFKHDGRVMLERIMNSNPKCDMYKTIANPNLSSSKSMYPRPFDHNHCGLVSMNNGLQRSLLASIALYKFYRDEQKVYSSDKVLKDLGIPRSNKDYVDMKNLLAMMSYSRIGSQEARKIAMDMRTRITPNMTLEQFRAVLDRGMRNKGITNYLNALDNKFNMIKNDGETLRCTGSY